MASYLEGSKDAHPNWRHEGRGQEPLIKVWTTRKGEAESFGSWTYLDHKGHFFMTCNHVSLLSFNPPVQAAMDLDARRGGRIRESAINQERPSLSLNKPQLLSPTPALFTTIPLRRPRLQSVLGRCPQEQKQGRQRYHGKLNESATPESSGG